MIVKKLKVYTCVTCPYYKIKNNKCRCEKSRKTWEFTGLIPEWCELDDY